MKYELQELRRRGAKSFSRQYGERTCARCQRRLGKLWNCGAVCRGCSHRICSRCRVGVGAAGWKCTVCHAYRDVKFRSGEWFLEQRAKKFPATTEMSTSQSDVRGDLLRVDSHRSESGFNNSTQKSLSDTDIKTSSHLFKGPSLPNLFKKSKDSDQEGSSTGAEEETPCGSEYSGGKRGSSSSISTDCGLFEGVSIAGELELALAFNTDTTALEITVGACRNLSYGDTRKKKCHPYVKLDMRPGKNVKMKTTVKKNTTDPVFNEVLTYHIERHLLFGKRLQVSVWHSGTLRRKVFLGEVLVPLDGWRFEDRDSQRFNWYPLCPKAECPEGGAVEQDVGNVLVRVKFSPKNQGV
ncbi:Synaptotagmin-like protein 3 [Liparis tanakae]|uniref:Synaptotagmin-like protein 3 n=1 Tax=Liparis tanakae TaxID=230148 RepID=A0A4Z2IFR3_9TELE|nr:Synaptotagmin-like protein 3 [Liparis tanakae]